MRIFFLSLIAALALAGCQREQFSAAPACVRSAEANVTFSDAQTPDHVIAKIEGPSCAEAAATLTIRKADGTLLWVFSAPYRLLTLGDGALPGQFSPTNAQTDQFLKSWAELTTQKTSALPAWPEGASGPQGDGLSYATHLGREAYEDLRGRDLPEVCFAVSAEGSECIIIDPASHEALSMARFGP